MRAAAKTPLADFLYRTQWALLGDKPLFESQERFREALKEHVVNRPHVWSLGTVSDVIAGKKPVSDAFRDAMDLAIDRRLSAYTEESPREVGRIKQTYTDVRPTNIVHTIIRNPGYGRKILVCTPDEARIALRRFGCREEDIHNLKRLAGEVDHAPRLMEAAKLMVPAMPDSFLSFTLKGLARETLHHT